MRPFDTLVLPFMTYGMMTSSNGNIFRVTGPLCGEFTGPGEFLTQTTARLVIWDAIVVIMTSV